VVSERTLTELEARIKDCDQELKQNLKLKPVDLRTARSLNIGWKKGACVHMLTHL